LTDVDDLSPEKDIIDKDYLKKCGPEKIPGNSLDCHPVIIIEKEDIPIIFIKTDNPGQVGPHVIGDFQEGMRKKNEDERSQTQQAEQGIFLPKR